MENIQQSRNFARLAMAHAVKVGGRLPLLVVEQKFNLVSVAVINYNYGQFVREAVNSALAQSYSPIEVVVVDDGSTDDSLTVLEEFSQRILVVRKDRGGHVSALNAGASASQGEVIIFLDADDRLRPDCVSKVMRVWRYGLSKVQFRLNTIDAEGVDQGLPFPHYSISLSHDQIRQRALRFGYYPWPVSSGNAYAREFVKNVIPIDPERIFKSQDKFLNKMAPLFGDVAVINEVLGDYRVHDRNAWAQWGRRINRETYARSVRFDAVLHAEFREMAARLGFCVDAYLDQPVPQWVKTRLLSYRLRREIHPIPNDTRWKILKLGARSATVAPGINLFGRLSWIAWLSLVTILHRLLWLRLLVRGRAQSHRSRIAQVLVSWVQSAIIRASVCSSYVLCY